MPGIVLPAVTAGLTFLSGAPGGVTPVDTAASSIVSYILGYGVVGIVALAFAFRFIIPASMLKESQEQARVAIREAREQARIDLQAERDRVIAEKRAVEEQRDEAMKIAQDQLVPLLVSFTAATSSLIPLLQELVSDREGRRDRDSRDRR